MSSEVATLKPRSMFRGISPAMPAPQSQAVQEFDESDPLNASTNAAPTLAETTRSKKTRSISPHSRLLRRKNSNTSSDGNDDKRPTIVAVTSCRSDAYYHQKAPGSASKLPTKAPSALKLFHELATGVKDAYDAVGAMPVRPEMGDDGKFKASENEVILWEFMGNLDFVSALIHSNLIISKSIHLIWFEMIFWSIDKFVHLFSFFVQLLALVDEVAVDTATRGALKDDTTFKCLRDVIKKGNKVLENMLVRRERKYTLFFRLTTPQNEKHIVKMKKWNQSVEKAVGAVTDEKEKSQGSNDIDSMTSDKSESTSSVGSKGGIVSRGRNMLFVNRGAKSRRATPTPKLRNMYAMNGPKQGLGSAADDGFFANPGGNLNVTDLKKTSDTNRETTPSRNTSSPMTTPNVNKMQNSVQPSSQDPANNSNGVGNGTVNGNGVVQQQNNIQQDPQSPSLAQTLTSHIKPVQPKDELVDVIRGLKVEKQLKIKNGGQG